MYLYKYGYNCMRIVNCFYLNVVLVVFFCNYYIYNVEHNDGNNVFCFLALALMGVVPPKCPVSVKSIVGVL